MGVAYMQLLSDRDLLRVQLQAYAACGDEDVRQVVREEFAGSYVAVKSESGASNEEIHTSSPRGCCSTSRPPSRSGGKPDTWSLSRLLGQPDLSAEPEVQPDDRDRRPFFRPRT